MKKIIDYLFYRYYMVCLKNKEFPRFGATCILAEIIMMAYLFAVLILSFLLTRYLHYNKKRINALLEKYQDNRYNTKYSDKAVLSLSYIVPTVGLILMLLLYQFR